MTQNDSYAVVPKPAKVVPQLFQPENIYNNKNNMLSYKDIYGTTGTSGTTTFPHT
ncbi:hypothetical protein J9907_000614 [Salmonella enterica]|nr:hypothetical protein [Salmonella enterica]EGL8512445.1 hypothetical protein [Salmonella enterica]EHI9958155.1 hypothetical protein [Salmonella enterica]